MSEFIDDRFIWRGHGWRRGRGGQCRGSWRRWTGMEDLFPKEDVIDHHHHHHHHHFRPHHHFLHGRGMRYAPYHHFRFMRGCPPSMGFRARQGDKMTEEEFKVAEEAARVASQIASVHVADTMKEMWNAWSEEFMTKEHVTAEQSPSASGYHASKRSCAVNKKDKQNNESKDTTQEETVEEPPSSEIPSVNLVKDMDNEISREEIRRVFAKDVPPTCNELIFVNQDGEISKRYKRKNSFSSQKKTFPLKATSSDSHLPGPISHHDERERKALARMRGMALGYFD